jgi:DNA-binding MarR family transcriptional regulator
VHDGQGRSLLPLPDAEAPAADRHVQAQLRAVTVLNELGSATLAQLAEFMGVAVSTVSRLVDRLVPAGWLDRPAVQRGGAASWSASMTSGSA